MAYIERNILTDYPYFGTFYKTEIDKSLPLDKQVEEKIIIYETQCDITESSHSWSRNFIWAKYAVYFPYDIENDKINVAIGNLFEATISGLYVNGKVVGVFPSMLGGITCYIQDTDA